MSPMFILRKLDPGGLARMRAKAGAGGQTVRQVIPGSLTVWLGLLLISLLTTACGDVASPMAPVPAVMNDSTPYSLTLGSVNQTVTAHVQNLHGVQLANIMVTFTTNTGTLSDASVKTSAKGEASTTVTADGMATVSVAAATLTAKTQIASAPISPAPTPPSVAPPPVPAPPPPPPPPPPGPSASVTCTAPVLTATSPGMTTCAVTVANSPPMTSASWTLGDGATASGSSTAHSYSAAGPYMVRASASTSAGTLQATTSVTIAPPPALRVTVTCTTPASSSNRQTNCTASVSDASGVITGTIPSGSYTWDFGDGSAPSAAGGPSAYHTYQVLGTYLLAVTVTGPNTAQGQGTTSVVVP
jgi:hypothetical protein